MHDDHAKAPMPPTGPQQHFNPTRFAEQALRLGRRHGYRFSEPLSWAYQYRVFRPIARRLIKWCEGGYFHSRALRRILEDQYGVLVGDYSYGPCLKPGELPPGTRIGRYCSLGPGIQVFRRNHPKDWLSLHPFFYNCRLGLVERDLIARNEDNPLTIGHDVWIGAATIILPGCRTIDNGAIIGAGAVVTKDVPAFAIVAGNPAKIIGYRFPEALREKIEESRWWEKSLAELGPHAPAFVGSLSAEKLMQSGLFAAGTNGADDPAASQ